MSAALRHPELKKLWDEMFERLAKDLGSAPVPTPAPKSLDYLWDWYDSVKSNYSGLKHFTATDLHALFPDKTATRLGRDLVRCPFATRQRNSKGNSYVIDFGSNHKRIS